MRRRLPRATCAAEVRLQAVGFVDGCGFGERDDGIFVRSRGSVCPSKSETSVEISGARTLHLASIDLCSVEKQ